MTLLLHATPHASGATARPPVRGAVLLAAALCAAPLAAGAGFLPGDDLVGIYTAPDASAQCWLDLGLGQGATLYLCLTAWSDPIGVTGWEMRIEWPATGLLVVPTLMGGAVNIGEGSDFIVGLAAVLRGDEAIVLAELELYSLSGDVMTFTVGPASVQTLPGEMCYAGIDPGFLYPMFPSSGDPSLPVFYLNRRPGANPCDDTTPAARRSWSGVKALYR